MHKLDPIERLPDGTLFRLTPRRFTASRKQSPPANTGRCRQFRGEKPLNCKPSRTAKAARQYDFPRSREIEFYLST